MDRILADTTNPSKPSETESVDRIGEVAEESAELHTLSEPMRLDGLWFVACSCGAVSEGKHTRGAALEAGCVFEAARVASVRNMRHFLRACRTARVLFVG